jgi:hypothetical protein
VKKTSVSKPFPGKKPKGTNDHAKRMFGSAKGQIIFKQGWDAPMTKRELNQFIGVGDLGPDIRKLKRLMTTFRHPE